MLLVKCPETATALQEAIQQQKHQGQFYLNVSKSSQADLQLILHKLQVDDLLSLAGNPSCPSQLQ